MILGNGKCMCKIWKLANADASSKVAHATPCKPPITIIHKLPGTPTTNTWPSFMNAATCLNWQLLILKKGKKEVSDLSPEFQRVYSMDYVSPNEIALSAAVKGQSDIFVYRTITRQTERITNDFWDDLDVSVATVDGRKLLFASNRMTDTLSFQRLDSILPITNFDIFLFDLESRSPELVRITNTALFSERNPIGRTSHFSFLSDESGIINQQAGKLEPFVAYHQAVIYLKDGAEVKTLDMTQPMEWPLWGAS